VLTNLRPNPGFIQAMSVKPDHKISNQITQIKKFIKLIIKKYLKCKRLNLKLVLEKFTAHEIAMFTKISKLCILFLLWLI